MAGGIVLGSVTVSAASANVLLHILVAIKASFLKFNICNICKNCMAQIFLVFSKCKIVDLIEFFFIFCKKTLGGFAQKLKYRYI